MQKKVFEVLTLILVVSAVISCRKGDVGPKGDPASFDIQSLYEKEGFIKGTAVGTTVKGSPYSYELNLNGHQLGIQNFSIIQNDTITRITLNKTDLAGLPKSN